MWICSYDHLMTLKVLCDNSHQLYNHILLKPKSNDNGTVLKHVNKCPENPFFGSKKGSQVTC